LSAEICFAHLSDWHATSLKGGGAALLRGKRISGFASWALNRRRYHDPAILAAAIEDVHAIGPDRILVTGDLTHVSLESEFRAAAGQLASLGTAEQVFLVPGNHDCYVPTRPERSWDHWADYLRGDSGAEGDGEGERGALDVTPPLASNPPAGHAPCYADYPMLRMHGGLAMIGLCSAIPTPIFRAGGVLGEKQLERLEGLLGILGERGCFRVVMIHHPVAAKGEPARRALLDGDELRGVLGRAGAELVLHGHKHRRRVNYVPGPEADVPIIGVPSSSEVGSKPDKAAQYHVYRVTKSGAGFSLKAEVRGYDAVTKRFVRVDESLLG